jgi:hypothetical protein
MMGTLVRRCGRVGVLTVLGITAAAPISSAEPIRVTAGFFNSPEDGPPGFSLEGDGLRLSGFFPLVTASPRDPCVAGCLPGLTVDMSTVAGGESSSRLFTLGTSPGALINGTEFGDLGQFGPMVGLTGVMRFDAPTVVLPPFESNHALRVPFVFTANVTGFAADDLAAAAPLFNASLVGQGTATLEFLEGIGGSYFEPYVTYTFSATPDPIPEPGTLLLLATGVAVSARRWQAMKQH